MRLGLRRPRGNCDLFNFTNLKGDDVDPSGHESKAWFCDCSLAGIVGLNPAEGMGVCLLCILCAVRVLCVGLIARP